ncbi:hypothetical protein K505DRAFT_82965 [Melanomma pulvis-pyrius CBS 109.77]|uniref:Uncharacterized protein n=1 Tax=Melanomma pulvis-pyrius CBS 109.77 TaxID=1314802 RepID=A0A6A6XRD9_9PLEO|nr:hypothetical protein K505DRAFT_82965 [Melanomma pulvis-pyrius CBS 109.77]
MFLLLLWSPTRAVIEQREDRDGLFTSALEPTPLRVQLLRFSFRSTPSCGEHRDLDGASRALNRIEVILRRCLFLISDPCNNNSAHLSRLKDLIGWITPAERKVPPHTNSCRLECISDPLAALQPHGYPDTARHHVGPGINCRDLLRADKCSAAVCVARISPTHAHSLVRYQALTPARSKRRGFIRIKKPFLSRVSQIPSR